MNLGTKILLVMVLGFLCNNFCKAEKTGIAFRLGAYGDYNRIYQNSFITGSCLCSYPAKGIGNGYSFGALFELGNIKIFNFQARVGFSDFSNMLKSSKYSQSILNNGNITKAEYETTLNTKVQGLSFDYLVNMKLFKGLFASVGTNFTYVFKSGFNSYEQIISPPDLFYPNGQRTRNQVSGDKLEDNDPLQFNIIFGLSYDIALTSEIFITPEFKYYYLINSLSSNRWKTDMFIFGLSSKISLNKSKAN